jgi:hypothetical protein
MSGTDAECSATGNEAALRFRLRADGIADLPDHAALRRFAAADPDRFQTAILDFAGLGAAQVAPAQAVGLAAALAVVLLEADLRPDDRLLVAGTAPWPWEAARTQGIPVILAREATPASLRAVAEAERASAIAAPPAWLEAAGLTAGGLPGFARLAENS